MKHQQRKQSVLVVNKIQCLKSSIIIVCNTVEKSIATAFYLAIHSISYVAMVLVKE